MSIPPPPVQERIICSIDAANKYGLPASVLLAVAFQEGGQPGQKVLNRNGTIDYGPLQINTVWLAQLHRYGILPSDVQAGCYPYDLAAWRLSQHLKKDRGTFWEKIANYHSYTPSYNAAYRLQVERRAVYWDNWLFLHQKTLKVPLPALNTPPREHQNSSLITSWRSHYIPRRILQN